MYYFYAFPSKRIRKYMCQVFKKQSLALYVYVYQCKGIVIGKSDSHLKVNNRKTGNNIIDLQLCRTFLRKRHYSINRKNNKFFEGTPFLKSINQKSNLYLSNCQNSYVQTPRRHRMADYIRKHVPLPLTLCMIDLFRIVDFCFLQFNEVHRFLCAIKKSILS